MSEHAAVVFVIDDDPSMLRSLASLLRSVGLEARVFSSAPEFMRAQRPDAPGCLVLDVRLPGMSGLAFQQELAKAGIALPVIFITGHGDVPMSVRAMKAGAVEFLTKPLNDDALLSAIGHALDQSRAALGHEAEIREVRERYESLSRREREVMSLVVSGLLNKQVGGELQISEITVKAHRGKVMRKMKADSLADLVNMAARLHLTPVRRV